jgi:hypothetical protein
MARPIYCRKSAIKSDDMFSHKLSTILYIENLKMIILHGCETLSVNLKNAFFKLF